METLLPIIVQVVTGIIGGQAVGAAVKQAAMGQLPKILSGAIGGLGGAAILGQIMQATADGSFNLENIVGGAGGGAILTAIVGVVMNAMKK